MVSASPEPPSVIPAEWPAEPTAGARCHSNESLGLERRCYTVAHLGLSRLRPRASPRGLLDLALGAPWLHCKPVLGDDYLGSNCVSRYCPGACCAGAGQVDKSG
jgi:hypothetical protein